MQLHKLQTEQSLCLMVG